MLKDFVFSIFSTIPRLLKSFYFNIFLFLDKLPKAIGMGQQLSYWVKQWLIHWVPIDHWNHIAVVKRPQNYEVQTKFHKIILMIDDLLFQSEPYSRVFWRKGMLVELISFQGVGGMMPSKDLLQLYTFFKKKQENKYHSSISQIFSTPAAICLEHLNQSSQMRKFSSRHMLFSPFQVTLKELSMSLNKRWHQIKAEAWNVERNEKS